MAREGRGCDMHRHGTSRGSKSFVFAAYLPSELKIFAGLYERTKYSSEFSGLQVSDLLVQLDNGSTSQSPRPSLNKWSLPRLASPGETLRQRVDLIVVPPRKRQQFRNKLVQPGGVLRQKHRTAHEQVDLRNQALLLVAFGLVIDDVDVLLAQRLDQAVTNAAVLDDERGRLSITLLHLNDLVLQSVERKLAANDVKYEVQIATVE